jgi:hypothetical protein
VAVALLPAAAFLAASALAVAAATQPLRLLPRHMHTNSGAPSPGTRLRTQPHAPPSTPGQQSEFFSQGLHMALHAAAAAAAALAVVVHASSSSSAAIAATRGDDLEEACGVCLGCGIVAGCQGSMIAHQQLDSDEISQIDGSSRSGCCALIQLTRIVRLVVALLAVMVGVVGAIDWEQLPRFAGGLLLLPSSRCSVRLRLRRLTANCTGG